MNGSAPRRISVASSLTLVVVLVLVLVNQSGAQDDATERAAEYVGDEVCAACHEGLLGAFNQTVHARVHAKRPEHMDGLQTACESCHGPGSQHVAQGGGKGAGMRSFAAVSGEAAHQDAEACLSCHAGDERRHWEGSSHDLAEVSCASCHKVMEAVSSGGLLARRTQTETCSSCHLLPRSRLARRSHMPVAEGNMNCSSCHNPHGSIAPSLLDAPTLNDNCYQCHAEKRGPFLFEHPPVIESCANCHHPHGSTRRAMLKADAPRLCQQCHSNSRHPSTPRTPGERFVLGRSCLNCHPAVHGSNHPSGGPLTR